MHSIAGRSAIGAILALSTVSGMGQCRFPKEGRADAIENSILGVAVLGAAIVIVATGTSSTLLHRTRADIGVAQSEIAEMRRKVDRLWGNHLQADQRSAAAAVFFAQALVPSANRSFLLQQAAFQLRGAVLSMWAASGEAVPDEILAEIAASEKQLGDGDARGYASMKKEVDRLRLGSQTHLNGLADQIRAVESRIESGQVRESWIYLAYVFFNLLGLMVTMCKDLSVWKADRRGERVACPRLVVQRLS